MIRRAFVLGHPVAHSRSPLLHGYWLRTLGVDGAYDLQDVRPEDLRAFFASFAARGYVGGNVTVPHKVAALDLVSRVDATARAVGAVNTVWLEDGAVVGGNTDAAGFIANLDDRAPGWRRRARPAIVLGAGGAARAAVFGLLGRGITVHLLNRTIAKAQALAAHLGGAVHVGDFAALPALLPGAGLLVNTTSLGMTGKPPLDIDLGPARRDTVIHDIVYAPVETALLRQARERGLPAVDGLGMLLHQAVAGFAHWFGITPTVTPELRALVEADIGKT